MNLKNCMPRTTAPGRMARLLFTCATGMMLLAVFPNDLPAASEKGPRCSDEVDNDGDGYTDCDDSDCKCFVGGGNLDISQVPVTASWSGSHVSGDLSRMCVLGSAEPDGSSGAYGCQTGLTEIHFQLSGLSPEQIARRGNPELCEVFDSIWIEPNSAYKFRWLEVCSAGSRCEVMIQNWFKDHDIDGIGIVKLVAFADADGSFSDPNPFVDAQTLNVDEVQINFTKEGTNRTAATCLYTDISVGVLQLDTTPSE